MHGFQEERLGVLQASLERNRAEKDKLMEINNRLRHQLADAMEQQMAR